MSRPESRATGDNAQGRDPFREVRNESTSTEPLEISRPSTRSKHNLGDNIQSASRPNSSRRAKTNNQKSSDHKLSKNEDPITSDKAIPPITPIKDPDIPYYVYYLPGGFLYVPEGYLDGNGLPTRQALRGPILHLQAAKTRGGGGEDIFTETDEPYVDTPPTSASSMNSHSPYYQYRRYFSPSSPCSRTQPERDAKCQMPQYEAVTLESLQPWFAPNARHSRPMASSRRISPNLMENVDFNNRSNVSDPPILHPSPLFPYAHCDHERYCPMAFDLSGPPMQASHYPNPVQAYYPYWMEYGYPPPHSPTELPATVEAPHPVSGSTVVREDFYQLVSPSDSDEEANSPPVNPLQSSVPSTTQVIPDEHVQPQMHYGGLHSPPTGIRLEDLPRMESGHVPLFYYQTISRPFQKRNQMGMWEMECMSQ